MSDEGRPEDGNTGRQRPEDLLGDKLRERGFGLADTATKGVKASWWAGLDDNQKTAVGALAAAAAIGPLGQGFLAAIKALYNPSIPSSEQIAAVFWLALISLPVFAAAVVIAGLFGKGHIMVILGFGAIAATVAGVILTGVKVPDQLGDFYCFAEYDSGGLVYEKTCRKFDAEGFVATAQSSGNSRDILGWAFIYTEEARGTVMAIAGVIAGAATGYLFRRTAA